MLSRMVLRVVLKTRAVKVDVPQTYNYLGVALRFHNAKGHAYQTLLSFN